MSRAGGSAELPVIDVGPLVGGARAAAADAIARQIEAACRDRGFFCVTGHGVPAGPGRTQLRRPQLAQDLNMVRLGRREH